MFLKFLKFSCGLASCSFLAACAKDDVALGLRPPGPAFCDVEEMRIFSQAEIDWRAAHAPWNLRRDLKTNATWEAECPPGDLTALTPDGEAARKDGGQASLDGRRRARG
ncbi:hypothetical protein [Pseudooceanicola sp. 200-1SW]|uniref:hypothetical protein n=1 Tax=Pseudooceanicola sp. 200-1SW TaxID=3425949 RepID=UPI003D7FFDAE